MEITNIVESGSNNILKWAISNGADIKEDLQLQSIINDELFFQATLSGVNFFELFRLTQMYRDKVRIINEHPAATPPYNELSATFKGSYKLEDNKDPIPMGRIAEYAINGLMDLSMQMQADDDIIRPNASRLFIPMICRKFDVQIPISFMDLIGSMSPNESEELFSSQYPDTLQNIINNKSHGANRTLQLGFSRGTNIIKYHKQFERYMNVIKYSPLNTCKTKTLYKYKMIDFYKYDNITRGEVRCSLFHPDPKKLGMRLKRLGQLQSPLRVDFVIQIPIQYMEILTSSFSQDVLPIAYESSMNSIIGEGLNYDDFIIPEFNMESEDENEKHRIETYNNSINAYRVRITETNQALLNTMNILLKESGADGSAVFSMIPSIYMAKAVITLDITQSDIYLNHYDPFIASLFRDMLDSASVILEDINKTKQK